MAGTRWDTAQYLRFADHRQRPGLELLERIALDSPGVVYDLGCGTGDIARLMAKRWPLAQFIGVDNSPDMLEKAAATPGSIQWVAADIAQWQPAHPADLIYSNATLHWLDGHTELFPRMVGWLKPGGCLAVQMPLSWGAPSHALMRTTLANGGPDGAALGSGALRLSMDRDWVASAAAYYDMLAGMSRHIDIWETEYLQILEGDDPVFEWVKSTGLRPVLNGLEHDEYALFVAEYKRRLREAYPMRADGRTLYPFRRLFIVATMR